MRKGLFKKKPLVRSLAAILSYFTMGGINSNALDISDDFTSPLGSHAWFGGLDDSENEEVEFIEDGFTGQKILIVGGVIIAVGIAAVILYNCFFSSKKNKTTVGGSQPPTSFRGNTGTPPVSHPPVSPPPEKVHPKDPHEEDKKPLKDIIQAKISNLGNPKMTWGEDALDAARENCLQLGDCVRALCPNYDVGKIDENCTVEDLKRKYSDMLNALDT